ncbi:PREDICTED: odorant receptor 46a, isoform A-like [Vollenhovia emeryi]|uniref:odorant receptor 46a, isoform A-like n=1 Tax=Vollenhovia emeryi TaxID=411798 RepID=UPI0005F4B5C2|nr:PREDICTED: odorant receptor 46a, isoform A-like [Vollenhovia emeryi]
MHILRFTYTIVTISGCCRPQSWTSLFKRTVYNIYSLYVITMIYTFTILQIMDIILNVDNTDDFADNLNMMMTVLASCFKIFIACLNYDNIVALINYLTKEPFKPLDTNEMKIRQHYEKVIRNNTLRFIALVTATGICVISSSIFTDFRHKKLKYREWIPYNYSHHMIFCFTYIQQMLSVCHSAVVHIAIDSLVCGFLMHICCQIEILEYRLKKILSNQLTVGYCVWHHNLIFKYAQVVNIRFTKIVGLQFMTSTMTICCNLYQLSQSPLNTSSIGLIGLTCCMLTEIFIYCWFGHKMKSKSVQLVDSIFHIKWSTLTNNVKRNLLIIMKRAIVPIEFTTAHMIGLNLDSFVALLKTSYSAYNLLVRVREK